MYHLEKTVLKFALKRFVDNPFGDESDSSPNTPAQSPQFQEQRFGSNQTEQKQEETSFSPQSQSISRLTAATRFYIRRPREPDQVLVSHDVTKKFEGTEHTVPGSIYHSRTKHDLSVPS